MKRVLAVLIGAGVAVGGGVAAWAGPNREAARACAAEARAADPEADRARIREAVRSCLEEQGITLKDRRPLTPEQQARRDALRTCLRAVKEANPEADRTALREAARPCLEQAGIAPGQLGEKAAAVRRCRQEVRAAHPDADRAARRDLVRDCVASR